jgi:hypothetical protein
MYGKSAAQPFILEGVTPSVVAQWQPYKQYKKGDMVVPTFDPLWDLATLYGNDHYYQAQSDGWSGGDASFFDSPDGKPRVDGTVVWKDMGSLTWKPNQSYEQGALVAPDGIQGEYYQAKAKGKSGNTKPDFQPNTELKETGTSLTWKDVGGAQVSHFRTSCANANPSKPLVMNQILTVAIDMFAIKKETQDRFRILNLNLTNQQGAPLNPTPIRPGLAAATATGASVSSVPVSSKLDALTSQVYYLTWPNQLTGDANPTVAVNLVYTPVAPLLPWAAGSFYPAGSVVISEAGSGPAASTNGHYYLALNSGTSETATPYFEGAAVRVPVFVDGSAVGWKDMGLTPTPWQKGADISSGQRVTPNPPNGHYYEAQTSGKTGKTPPVFPQNGKTVLDNGVRWQDLGTAPAPVAWTKNMTIATGVDIMPTTKNGHFYRAQKRGTTGSTEPGFATNGTIIADGPGLVWQEGGATPTPPVWKPSHAYAQGEVVTSDPANGHYYQAVVKNGKSSGTSGKTAPGFPVDLSTKPDSDDLSWKDLGLAPVFSAWTANTAFAAGALVIPTPLNGHYYKALGDGVTGQNQPPFPVDSGHTVSEPSNLTWLDVGSIQPTTARIKTWTPLTPFFIGDVIEDTSSGHYYSVVQAGLSSSSPPAFSVPAPQQAPAGAGIAEIRWQDLGATLPSSVSGLGTTPADQTVNLITYALPQVHALSYFNLTSGVIVSNIKTNNFINTGSSSSPNWVSQKNGIIVDPVLALTAYFKPFDAERPWHKSDLIPGATLAISLTSPSSNFYFGGSSEFPKLKNVQITYGFALVRGSVLEPPYLSNTAVSKTHFFKGGFLGITFNIIGFIQSL